MRASEEFITFDGIFWAVTTERNLQPNGNKNKQKISKGKHPCQRSYLLCLHILSLSASNYTLGARDFSSAVSGLCQVFIVFLAASPARGFGLRPKMCRPSANTENFLRTREKSLVPRVQQLQTCYQRLLTAFGSVLPKLIRGEATL